MEVPIPFQVADRLRGREFADFNQFRAALWRAVADVPELAGQFSPSNLAHLRRGLPPKAPPSQQVPGSTVCHLHILDHHDPYNVDNLRIISPLRHYQMVHYGGVPYGQGEWNIDKHAIKNALVPVVHRLMTDQQLGSEQALALIEEFERNAFYPSAADLVHDWRDQFKDAAAIVDFALGQEEVEKLSREELIAVAAKLMAADIRNMIESERLSMQLKANVPHPEGDGLIFYPKVDLDTPEEVVDHALAYKPS